MIYVLSADYAREISERFEVGTGVPASLSFSLVQRVFATAAIFVEKATGIRFHAVERIVQLWITRSEADDMNRNTSEIMKRVRSRNTEPELRLRKALRERGYHYRLAPEKLPGKPDIVIPANKLAIFVDGDYWHGNQWVRRELTCLEDQFKGSVGRDYWLGKIRGNMLRDVHTTDRLLSEGWVVLRLWETDVMDELERCMALVEEANGKNGKRSESALLVKRNFAEFFAGIGLMRIGLEKQGWAAAFANDIDPKKYLMYREQFHEPDSLFLLADVRTLRGKDVPDVTLATASFPCTDLSLAGPRSGLSGSRSSTFWDFARILREMGSRKPPLCLIENVPGFLTSHDGEDLETALRALNRTGYLVDLILVDASHFVPQSRERLFLVATDRNVMDSSIIGFHTEEGSDARPPRVMSFINAHRDLDWYLRPLPSLPRRASDLGDVLEDLPPESRWWWNRARAEYLLDQMSQKHRKTANLLIAQHKWSYGTVFRRVRNGRSMAELRVDGIAGCLRTPKGGSAKQILMKMGHGGYHVRLLTPRECSRLMGAEAFEITVSDDEAFFGFGDAVCVNVIEWIAAYYLNPLVSQLIRGKLLHQ